VPMVNNYPPPTRTYTYVRVGGWCEVVVVVV
jgi:hypothetical protein